ncbi:MAG TPA: SLBB domain-containing protein [Fimbriimonadaceae bacterium]|nr:SLBB domain-containing protein [Fimbriimonadaceae bacterium]
MLGVAYAQRLAPGDHIKLICEQEPTLSVERTLSPDGEVVLPLIGRVRLAGDYIVEAEDRLQKLAATKLGTDWVTIRITLASDQDGPVDFAGAVSRSGSVPFHTGMTLDEVVKLAEPTVAAAVEAVEIMGANGKKLVVDLTHGGGTTRLRAGDRIFFPRATEPNEIIVLGGVERPGSKDFKPDMTLRSLIDLAGGITGHGESGKIRLERKGEKPRVLDLAVKEDAELPLRRGDILTVPILENGRFVTLTGNVKHVGLLEFRDGMTLSEAIDAAGGLTFFAGSGDSISVKRLGEWKHRFDLSRIKAGLDPDLVLKPADIVDVGLAKPAEDTKPKKPRTGPVVPPI